ncbi:MAG: hypothetical protein RMK29_09415 [Myxococcales bacterium]|nr:hypothetical protein [Myxococcota bacterium]MDW8281918.1 hypothetical protein [Myxococcales bacterium]
MRTLLAVALLGLGCGPKEPPAPSEYIQLRYQLTPGGGSEQDPLLLPIPGGLLPCGRQAREIRVAARKGLASVQIVLKDAATMPSELQASTATSGKVNMEVVVPDAAEMGVPTVFSTADPGDLFVCRLRVAGPDPFREFRATFGCQSKPTAPRRLTVTDGEARALLCF